MQRGEENQALQPSCHGVVQVMVTAAHLGMGDPRNLHGLIYILYMLLLTYPNSRCPCPRVGREAAAVEVSLAILRTWSRQILATGWALRHSPVPGVGQIQRRGTAVILRCTQAGGTSPGTALGASQIEEQRRRAGENKHFVGLFLCCFLLTLFPVGCWIALH